MVHDQEHSVAEAFKGDATVSSESRVYRFLLHGRLDLPVGDLAALPATSGATVNELKKIFSDHETRKAALDLIDRLYRRGEHVPSPLPKTVPFLMALIARCCEEADKTDKKTLNRALGVFANLPEEFCLFVRFYLELPFPTKRENVTLLIGSWYVKHDWRTLAKLVGEGPVNGGWNHRSIISYDGLIRFDDPCRQAVLEWATSGHINLPEDREVRTSEFAAVLEYFYNLESLRETRNPAVALDRIRHWLHGVRDVHPLLKRDKNILKALIKRMDVRHLNQSIDQMSSLKLFRDEGDSDWDVPFVRQVSYRLASPAAIKKASLQPSESFITLQTYLNKWKVMNESALDEDELSWLPEPKISDDISSALKTQMDLAYENVRRVDSDILVVVDTNLLDQRYCEDEEYVRADQAAAFMSLTLRRTGRNVRTVTFNGSSPVEVTGETLESISGALSKYRSSSTAPFSDLVRQSSSDLVVLIGYALRTGEYFNMLNSERITRNLVLCNLSKVRVEAPKDNGNILVTTGFNRNTCEVITAFATFNLETPMEPERSKLAYRRVLKDDELRKREDELWKEEDE